MDVPLEREVDEDESVKTLRVLAVSQSLFHVGCDVSICCRTSTKAVRTFQVYFDPASDDVILVNTGTTAILVTGDGQRQRITVYPLTKAQLSPGKWDICTTKMSVFPRRFLSFLPPSALLEQPHKKRGTSPDARDPSAKRTRGAGPLIRTLSAVRNQGVTAASHPLLDVRLQPGQPIELNGSTPEENYSITRIKSLYNNRASSVWRISITTLGSPSVLATEGKTEVGAPVPQSVVVKVLKPSHGIKTTASSWLQETSIHSQLNTGGPPTIVKLLGLDARLHSLYLEDIDAPSLAAWRGSDNYFSGTSDNACRILNDMASALAFVHGLGITHNDIKPGNILFSLTRGAVLIDFGLSKDSTSVSVSAAGTPWYVPPEFIADPQTGRGSPGDVWALGVVMLYLRRCLCLPDKTTD